MIAAALALLLLGGALRARGEELPSSVQAMLPALDAAERALQDSTLDLEAARRDAAPAQRAVDAARGDGEGWLQRWRLERALARLKERLDAVETARRGQASARQAEFTLLSGLEEELRGSLEAALAKGSGGPDPAVLGLWWTQEQAWSRRVEALEAAALEASESGGQGQGALLMETRLQELDRDEGLLGLLQKRRVLGAAQARAQRLQIQELRRRWGGSLQSQGRKI